MVPVEPISLSIGAVALATLFSTCLECFEYFQAAKNLAPDFKYLLLNLDCQKELLITWGDLAGINKTPDEGRNPALDTSKAELISKCLESIKLLCKDAEKLQNEYGVQRMDLNTATEPVVDCISSSRANIFQKSFQRICHPSNAERQPSITAKARWAIHDKEKFEVLISRIETLINNLHNLVPVSKEAQKRMVLSDIGSLGVSNLHLVQAACNGTAQQAWSDAASAILIAAEAGTVDPRKSQYVEEWVLGADKDEDGESLAALNRKSVRQPMNSGRVRVAVLWSYLVNIDRI